MRRLVLAFIVALPLGAALSRAQSRPDAPSSGLQLDALDRGADPCNDFYQFACGGWLATNPVPPDRSSWGRFEEVQERNNDTLHTILETAAAGGDPDTKVNGKLTLGENTADNGGVRISLMAYLATAAAAPAKTGTIDNIGNIMGGFTLEQRVFPGWGQVWCQNQRPEAARMLAQTNPHSPGRHRVNGVVSNMPEFQKAFSCKADAPMVRRNVCRVW